IDGLRYAYDRIAVFSPHSICAGQGSVPADHHQRADPALLPMVADLRHQLRVGNGIQSRCADDCAAFILNSGGRMRCEPLDVALDQTPPTFKYSEDGQVFERRATNNRANHRVQSGAVSAAGQYTQIAFHAISAFNSLMPERLTSASAQLFYSRLRIYNRIVDRSNFELVIVMGRFG